MHYKTLIISNAIKIDGKGSDEYNKNDIDNIIRVLNHNTNILNQYAKDIEELKEAIKIKSVAVHGVIETTGAAVQEEIKNDIDPDIKNLFDALKEIKKICSVHRTCTKCIFYNNNYCMLDESVPENWEI